MLQGALKKLLEGLDLLANNAVFFRDKEIGPSFPFSSEIQKKLDLIKPDAYFVFNNHPYILFFDLTEGFSTERETQIHKQVWSFDNAPLIFIVKSDTIHIYNAFDYEKKNNLLQEIKLDEQERNKQFSFWNLQSGKSWKWLESEYYNKNIIQKKRVNQRLFENIKEIRKQLTDDESTDYLTDDEANILILRLIFIRYLIDRGVKIDESFIKGNTILDRRKNFGELIEQPERLNVFFNFLNDRFNSVLFKDTEIKLSKSLATSLSQIFTGIVNPNIPTLFDKTNYYFDVFDFSIIPVEVISGIYESLISPETRNEHSAIYTPSFLVDYILADTVDKYLEKNKTSECKIFDPACGSGIFLVQAYRRMVDTEKKLFGDKVTKTRLREIAQNNLFGVDLNDQAIKVTCFSIYIAILDYQDPKTIIDNFKFPKMIDENFFGKANFFDCTHPFNEIIRNKEVNFILGNPPWKNGSKDSIHVKYLFENKLVGKKNEDSIVSDYQLAQSFIIRTKDFTNDQTKCCLIVTSKAFYNINAENFRTYFLRNFYLNSCFDLSPVRRLIFEGADNPAMILHYQYANGNDTLDTVVYHQSLKYNVYLKNFKSLVIERNDYKEIKQRHFYYNKWMFKVALYGGTLDILFLEKLSKGENSIGETLLKKHSIEAGNGIHSGTPKRHFTDLIGMRILETESIKEYFTPITNDIKILEHNDVYLEAGRNAELFKGSKILFTRRPKKETFISISLCNQDAVFRNSAYGIPLKNKENILYQLYATFISNLFTYYQYLTTSNWGIYYPDINLDEYLSFPYTEATEEVQEKLMSLVKNFLKSFQDFYITDNIGEPTKDEIIFEQINDTINKIYKVKTYEKDLIDYVLNVSRYQFQGEKKQKIITEFAYLEENHYRNKTFVMRQYADVFIKEFEKIYDDEYLQVDVYTIHNFIAMNFTFLKEKKEEKPQVDLKPEISDIQELFEKISGLSISKIASSTNADCNLFIQKDIIGFEESSFYIIKPNEYKCWHRAMAWYDVAEIKEKIEEAELKHLNEHYNA